MVNFGKWGQIGIKGRERLSAGPFVLHDAKEIDHLVAKGHKVFGGTRGDFASDAA